MCLTNNTPRLVMYLSLNVTIISRLFFLSKVKNGLPECEPCGLSLCLYLNVFLECDRTSFTKVEEKTQPLNAPKHMENILLQCVWLNIVKTLKHVFIFATNGFFEGLC
ncbi:hypothetical protein Psfp_02542 [Pelotomaculum sp. FP]|nr:hypothetical protein Psfp_02542 [Pelotomaculum sp. FP]